MVTSSNADLAAIWNRLRLRSRLLRFAARATCRPVSLEAGVLTVELEDEAHRARLAGGVEVLGGDVERVVFVAPAKEAQVAA